MDDPFGLVVITRSRPGEAEQTIYGPTGSLNTGSLVFTPADSEYCEVWIYRFYVVSDCYFSPAEDTVYPPVYWQKDCGPEVANWQHHCTPPPRTWRKTTGNRCR